MTNWPDTGHSGPGPPCKVEAVIHSWDGQAGLNVHGLGTCELLSMLYMGVVAGYQRRTSARTTRRGWTFGSGGT
jgi:hypothetical protein